MADARNKIAEIMAATPLDYNMRRAPVPSDISQSGEIRNQPSGWTTAAGVANAAGDLSFELTGLPSIARGSSKMYGADEPLEFAAGASEAAMGALPGASATRMGGAVLGKMFSSAPRAIGASVGLSSPQTAEAAVRAKKQAAAVQQEQQAAVVSPESGYSAMQSAVKGDPELETLFTAWRSADQKSGANIPGVSKDSADGIRTEERTKAEGLKKELLTKLDAKRKQNAPFRERYPGMAETIGGTTAALATALPFANAMKGRLSRTLIENPAINRLTTRLDQAFQDGTLSPAKIAQMQDELKLRVQRSDAGRSLKATGKDFAKNWGLSSMLAFEGSAVPEQVDVLAYAPGHTVRENAQKELTRGGYYQDRVPAAALSGLLTAGIGTKAGAVITPGGEPSRMPAARELINRGSDDSIAQMGKVTNYLKAAQDQKQALAQHEVQSAHAPEALPQNNPAPQPVLLQSQPAATLPAPQPVPASAVPQAVPAGHQNRTGVPNQPTIAPPSAPVNVPASKGKTTAQRTEKLDDIWEREYSANARDVMAKHLASGGNLAKGAQAKNGGITIENLAASIKEASGGKGPGKPMTATRLDELRAALKDSGLDLSKITPAQLKKAFKNISPRVFSVGAMTGAGAAGLTGDPRDDMARIMAGG